MHPSTAFHLRTETALLRTLYTRSRAQHRAQLFLRNLEEVLRLARRVLAQLAQLDTPPSAPASRASSPKANPTPLAPLAPLLTKLLAALLAASRSTQRMLALAHFVPLQTLLAGAYGRLFAVAMYLAPMAGVDGARVVAGEQGEREMKAATRMVVREMEVGDGEVLPRDAGGDLGEKISRPIPNAARRAVVTETARGLDPRPEPKPEPKPELKPVPESEEGTRIEPSRRSTPAREPPAKEKRKERRDAVDDIFGVRKKAKKDKAVMEKKKAVEDESGEALAAGSAGKSAKRDVKATLSEKPTRSKADNTPTPTLPSDAAAKPKKEAKLKKEKIKDKSKKKRKDAMDDIFGF